MPPTQVTKIIYEDSTIGRKPLNLSDSLSSIRKILKSKMNLTDNFSFLDNNKIEISNENEDKITLEHICKDKTIYIKKVENNETNTGKIKILINDEEKFSINFSENQNLSEIRDIIKNKFKEDFVFILDDGCEVSKEDENDFPLSEALVQNSLKLKVNESIIPSNKNNKIGLNKEKEHFTKEENIKQKIENIVKIKDFSKFEVISKRGDLIFYKYSNLKRFSNHENIYEYNYDKLNEGEMRDACVILFCGKTGDGKSTAINAFFNIIKGVQFEDNYRFILITEPKKKTGQAESQTDGVHLYYLKDYKNRPLIIIDSQGYADTRILDGKDYDFSVDKAFSYIFSNTISHINSVIYILKATDNRMDILRKYIFASVTKLFAGEIGQNFLVYATHANRECFEEKPGAISTLETTKEFLDLKIKIDSNYWFAIDSKSILDNENDKVTKYSFQYANALYKDKILNLEPKPIQKSSEVLNNRIEARILVEQLNSTFQNLIIQQENLETLEKNIDKKIEETKRLEKILNDLADDMNRLDPKELEEKLSELNNEVNRTLDDFLNEKVDEVIKTLEISSYYNNICHSCKNNCQVDCQCIFSLLGRCKIFTFFTHRCEVCGCHKDCHKRDKYIFKFINKKKQKYSDYEISAAKQKNESRKQKILSDIDKNNNARNNLEKKINEFNTNKKIIMLEQEKIMNEKADLQQKIKNINNQIIFIIIKLQSISEKISDNCIIGSFTKNEDDYIDNLINQMDSLNIKEQDKIRKIKQIKENNRIFRQAVKIDKKDLMKLDDAQLAGLLKIIIPNYKK